MRNKPKATVYIIFQTIKKLWTYKNLLYTTTYPYSKETVDNKDGRKKYSTEPLTKKKYRALSKNFCTLFSFHFLT